MLAGGETYEWLDPGMRTHMDLEMGLLVEALITTWHSAMVSLPGFVAAGAGGSWSGGNRNNRGSRGKGRGGRPDGLRLWLA